MIDRIKALSTVLFAFVSIVVAIGLVVLAVDRGFRVMAERDNAATRSLEACELLCSTDAPSVCLESTHRCVVPSTGAAGPVGCECDHWATGGDILWRVSPPQKGE